MAPDMTPTPTQAVPQTTVQTPTRDWAPNPGRRRAGLLLALLPAYGLLACSAQYDWRELRDSGGGYVAVFPAKPGSATRRVVLDNLSFELHMQAAIRAETSFVVAWADASALPAADKPADAAAGGGLLASLRVALVKNIAGQQLASGPVNVARTDRSETPLAGEYLEAAGLAGGKPVKVRARLVAHGNRVFEAFVMGPPAILDSIAGIEAAETFLLSLRID